MSADIMYSRCAQMGHVKASMHPLTKQLLSHRKEKRELYSGFVYKIFVEVLRLNLWGFVFAVGFSLALLYGFCSDLLTGAIKVSQIDI
eukprot:XP_001709375.1 Hypothetical protein GL50803_91716 [Giardia lamblia ATCC 50803]